MSTNPHVYRGKPAVGQVWCKPLTNGEWLYCVIKKVDLYWLSVEYTPMGCHGNHSGPIRVFKSDWIFSH